MAVSLHLESEGMINGLEIGIKDTILKKLGTIVAFITGHNRGLEGWPSYGKNNLYH